MSFALAAQVACASVPVRHEDAVTLVCGTWNVGRVIPTKNIQTSPMKELLGQVVVYSLAEVSIGDRVVTSSPRYSKTTETRRTFFEGFHVDSRDLGIVGEPVLTVEVSSANRGSLYEVGVFLIVKDTRSLITVWDGVFYELDRLKPCTG